MLSARRSTDEFEEEFYFDELEETLFDLKQATIDGDAMRALSTMQEIGMIMAALRRFRSDPE